MYNVYKVNYIWIIDNKEYIFKAGFYAANSEHNEEIKITRRNFFNYKRYCPSIIRDSEQIKNPDFTATLRIVYEKSTINNIEELLKFWQRIGIGW